MTVSRFVSSVLSKICGARSRVVSPNRGLRQVDSLSASLFIPVFDVLSWLITKACFEVAIHGLKLLLCGKASG